RTTGAVRSRSWETPDPDNQVERSGQGKAPLAFESGGAEVQGKCPKASTCKQQARPVYFAMSAAKKNPARGGRAGRVPHRIYRNSATAARFLSLHILPAAGSDLVGQRPA